MRRALLACLFLLLGTSAYAQVGQVAIAVAGPATATYSGIADCTGCLTAPTAVYSLRAISAADAAPGTNIAVQVNHQISRTTTSNIKILTTGALDVASLISFAGVDATCTSATASGTTTVTLAGCSATPIFGGVMLLTGTVSSGTYPTPVIILTVGTFTGTAPSLTGTVTVLCSNCTAAPPTFVTTNVSLEDALYVQTLYDRSGNTTLCAGSNCNLVQAKQASQPWIVPVCTTHGDPCIVGYYNGTGPVQLQSTNNFTPATGVVSLVAYGNRTIGTAGVGFISENATQDNAIAAKNGVANKWVPYGTAPGATNVTATDNTWHAAAANINTTSSLLNIDGTDTSSSITTAATGAAKITVLGNNTTIGDMAYWTEAAVYDNVVSTLGNRTSVTTNMAAAW
jgi:hypothetical protein